MYLFSCHVIDRTSRKPLCLNYTDRLLYVTPWYLGLLFISKKKHLHPVKKPSLRQKTRPSGFFAGPPVHKPVRERPVFFPDARVIDRM